jgi:biotin operon repressor
MANTQRPRKNFDVIIIATDSIFLNFVFTKSLAATRDALWLSPRLRAAPIEKAARAILAGSARDMAHREKRTLAATAPQIASWSTDKIRPHERFAYWRDAVCSTVFGISIEGTPDDFSARIVARSVGAMRFAISESTGYQLVRSARDIAGAPSDHYSIYLHLSGRTLSSVSDRTIPLGANDFAVYDGRQPMRAMHAGRRAIAVVPRAMLDARAPWLRHRRPEKFAASPYLNLARRHLLQLCAPRTAMSEIETMLLTENLCNLVALASAGDGPTHRLPADLQLQAILAFCRQKLHDPDLAPQSIADRFGISVRTVYRDIKALGESGVPVSFEPAKGYFIVAGYFLPPVAFSTEEAGALLLMEGATRVFADKSIRQLYSAALTKVKAVLRASQKDGIEALSASTGMQLPPCVEADYAYLATLQSGIARRRIIEMDYCNKAGQRTRRRVEPVGLQFYAMAWHLMAWCHKRSEYRDFRVSRMESVRCTDEPFTIQQHPSLEQLTADLPVAF